MLLIGGLMGLSYMVTFSTLFGVIAQKVTCVVVCGSLSYTLGEGCSCVIVKSQAFYQRVNIVS